MAHFNLEDYETVETRIDKFWVKYPDGRISTELLVEGDVRFIVFASIYRSLDDTHPFATGYAEERVNQGMVNKTSALENCETSAIGRALANGGFATRGKRPSREEMQKVANASAKKQMSEEEIQTTLSTAVADVAEAENLDALKTLWSTHSDLLDEKIDGKSLRSIIMLRKEYLENPTVQEVVTKVKKLATEKNND